MPFEHLQNHWNSELSFRKAVRPIATALIVAAVTLGGFFPWKWATSHHHPNKPAAKTAGVKTGNASPASNKSQTNKQAPIQFEPGWYQLQQGDILSELALRAYKRADWFPIVHANPGLPQDLRTVQAGWWIYIPPYSRGKVPCVPCTATATRDTAPKTVPQKEDPSKAAEPNKVTQPMSDRLTALKQSAAAAAVTLAVAAPPITSEIDDPPLTSMANLPAMKAEYATISDTNTLVAAPQHAAAGKAAVRDHRTPKGYAVVLPPGMTASVIDRQLETRVYFFQPEERVATSQRRIGNSEVKVQKGQFVLYVPLKPLPSQEFNLAVAGLSGPVAGEYVRRHATPVYKHFPASSHRFTQFLFGTGQDAGAGTIAYFALGPIGGASAFAVTSLIRLARDHHQKVVAANEDAAKDAAVNANLDLERGEQQQQQQAALVSTSRGQAP